MRWIILMVSTLAVVNSRPQGAENEQDTVTKVEVEKQKIVELKPGKEDQEKISERTNEILEKIAEINKKQGLTARKHTPTYFHFPSSFSRSQQDEKPRSDFTFPTNPFSNPIFDYLEREKQENNEYKTRNVLDNNKQSQEFQQHAHRYEMSSPDAAVTEEDAIPGQYVKRKIVHQQTFLIPSQNMFLPSGGMLPQSPQQGYPPVAMSDGQIQDSSTGDKGTLEKQTVDNIRNIVTSSQLAQNQPYNPYQMRYGFTTPTKDYLGQLPQPNNPINHQIPSDPFGQPFNAYNYQVYGPFSALDSEKGRQNWNWPGANYFPIYIRDPFMQMYNAITSMIEYGPNAGQQNPCPIKKNKMDTLAREAKTAIEEEGTKISVEVDGDSPSPQIAITGLDSAKNNAYLDIENIDIGSRGDNSLKFTMSLKKEEREAKDAEEARSSWDKIRVTGKSSLVLNSTRSSSKFVEGSTKDLRPITVLKNQLAPKPTSTILSPPLRDPTRQTEEFGDETEDDKSEELISNDHNKKLFSRDNTGSGVFIHKLKVRKGGVAIAGPGGIATAGSGGTAIVGPNGVAYTQPDSLAIAGSGTKVVAVDPTINLGDLVNNTVGGNASRIDLFPPSRVGKVVAVGPVVYYNRG